MVHSLELAPLGLLLRDVLLDGVVEDRLDAELPQSVQNGRDLHFVLAGDEVAVKRRLHDLREQRLAQHRLGQLHELRTIRSEARDQILVFLRKEKRDNRKW